MKRPGNAERALKSIAAASLLLIGLSMSASAAQPSPPCDTPLDLVRLTKPLAHVAQKLTAGEPIIIVAIGSSSTAGAGASSPAASYPSRLQAELERMFPHEPITVINRGVNGEEVADMLKRFDQAVVAMKPDLVLWQLGTNSVIRDSAFTDHSAMIRDGLKKIRATGADVVLIDPQFAPRVIAKGQGAEHMVEVLSVTAKQENVDLFRRYDVMKRWREVDHMAFEAFVSPDGLHMNDWGYACMAKGLGLAIAEATRRPVLSATATHHLLP